MYFGDHPPPHFHLLTTEGTAAVFRIDTLELWAGEIEPRDAAEALVWAAENRELLSARWQELSEEES